ncbi:MAG: mechanosensitive ion channel family protein [Opitutales bacterium]|nr:mechanosensitive ion channel family protein [Opitutales bacterium]
MSLAQIVPVATPAPTAVPLAVQADHFIIGDLHKVVAKAPEDWSKIIIHAIGFVAVAYLVGWVASKLMRWISTKFGDSPIAEAAVAAIGKSLPFILPAYTLLFLIKDFKEALAFVGWLNFAVTSGIFLCSLAHTASVFYLVAIPIAWAQKVADQTENKLDDILVPMFSTVIRIAVVLVGAFKAISIIDPKSSDAILGLLAGAVVGLAFASQDTIKNVFGAVMLIIDQPFTLGDLINIGTHEGKVESLGLRSTTIMMLDGQKLVIPNSALATRSIVNITRRDFIRAQDLVHLEANTPAEKVREAVAIVRELLVDHEGSQPGHPPLVHVTEFADWAVNIRLMYWYHPAAPVKQLEFNQQLIIRIAERFQKADIRLAVMGTPQNR